jgi:hypothetical protein
MADNQFIIRKGYIALDDSQITGSLSVTNSVTASFFTGSFKGDGSQLSGVSAGFPFTGSATISGSLQVTGSVSATAFIGDGSQLTGIADPTPITATINNTNSPFTVTSQSIVIIDSTNGDVTVNLPDLDLIDGTPDQKPILLYKNDYSQNVIYVQPSGSQLVNGTTQDIIVSIQIAIAYNPTSAGWVTEGTSYQSLAELEMFFVPRTETGSFATTGSNQFSGSQTITGSLTVTGGIVGTTSTASYVEYANVANKPAIVSGSSQISFNGITDKPTLVSGSSQITYSGLTGIPSGIVSSSAQVTGYGVFATTSSNTFQANQVITGSLFITQNLVVAGSSSIQYISSSVLDIADNTITVNTFNPSVRFGGLGVIDSGSSPQVSGSILFDSIKDQWIFVHQNPTVVTSSVVLMGPETYNDLGNETYISANRLPKGSGVEHLRDSNISDTGTVVSVNSNTSVTGSLQVSGSSHYLLGSVGVGTISPLSRFHVNTGTNQNFRVRPGTDVGATNGVALNSRTDDDGSLQQLTLRASDVIMLTSGNVGIGTASPEALLHINAANAGGQGGYVYIDNPATSTLNNSVGIRFSTSTGGSFAGVYTGNIANIVTNASDGASALTFGTWDGSTAAERMRITSGGNVGIGSISPSEKLEVQDGYLSTYHNANSNDAGYGVQFYTNGGGSKNSLASILLSQVGTARSGNLTFNTSNAGAPTTKMIITSTGNVGIGTILPSTQLNVGHESHGIGMAYMGGSALPAIAGLFTDTSSGQQGYGSLLIKSRSDYAGYSINFFTAASANTPVERMRITSGGSLQINYNPGGGDLYFRDTTNGAVMFYIIPATYVGTAPFNSNRLLAANSSDISFETGGAERMRITSDGKIIVRQSNFTYPVSIEAQSGGGQLALTRSGAYAEFYMGGSTSGGTQLYVRSGGSGGVRLDAGSTGWVADSDIRLKDIEKPIENAVESLSTLQTVYYSWKDSENEKQHLGLIAQEVEAVFPEIVSESSITGMKGVNYVELIPVLVKAIQEQQSQIEILKAEIQTLKQ